MATLRDALNTAREITADTKVPYRVADDIIARYGNDALRVIALARPELFYSAAEIACIEGTTLQVFNAADSLGLVDIIQVKGGNAVTRQDRTEFDRIHPGWHAEDAAEAKHWIPLLDDPNRFFVYPKAPDGQVLIGLYVKPPATITLDDLLPVSSAYVPLIADYIVARLEAKDDEHVLNQRAAAFLSTFNTVLGISDQTNRAEKPK